MMLNDLKKTSKHTTVYAIGNMAAKVIGLILVPLYTNADYLTHAEYGALSVLEATSNLLIGILSMAMTNSLSRWYWEKKNETIQKSIFFTTLIFLFFTVSPAAVLLIYNSAHFSQLLFSSVDYSYLLKLTIGAASIQIINNLIFSLASLQSRSLFYSLMQILKLSLTLGLILFGILFQGKGLDAIWEANIIGELFALILFIPFVLKNVEFHFHYRMLKEMLRYGFPLMLASISGVLLTTADKYMLSSMSGLENTGVYSLGYRIANTLKVIISTSIMTALRPIRMQKIDEPDNKRFYSKSTSYAAFIFIITLLGISLFSLELLKVFTGSKLYWTATNIVPIISYGLLFGLLKDNMSIGLIIKKKTNIMGILIFITSLLNVGLNLLFIPLLDIYGAALATLVSQIFFLIGVTMTAQRLYPIPYEWKNLGVMIGISGLIILMGILLTDLNILIRLPMKIVLFISFPFILYWFNFYEKVELENIKLIFRNWSNPKKAKENIRRFFS